MTLNVCLGCKTSPEFILEPGEFISPDQKEALSAALKANIFQQTKIAEFTDHSEITTDLPLRHNQLTIHPEYRNYSNQASFTKSIQILDPDESKVILTLRRLPNKK
jgi:hypothetical protein